MTAVESNRASGSLRELLDEQVRLLAEHERGARAGTDPEHVHQLRVGVRRIRAALRAAAAAGPQWTELDGELRAYARALGPVRDLDVLLARLREQVETFPAGERTAADVLLRGVLEQHAQATEQMLAVFAGTRHEALLTALADVADEPGTGGPAPVAGSARELIDKPYRRFAKAAAALGEDPPDDDLHALRLHGKRLRYAAELSGTTQLRPLVTAAKNLQDLLGEHQDATVAEQAVRDLLAGLDRVQPDVAFVAGRLVQAEQQRRTQCRARWADAVRAVLAEGPR